jgi:hypothetical protein
VTTPAPPAAVQPATSAQATTAAALWRAVCALAIRIDRRITADDPGAVISIAVTHGGISDDDAKALRAYAKV